jgi:hypothetical protein
MLNWIFILLAHWSWWAHGSWIYKYLWNQCLSPLKLWVRIPLMTRCSQYNIIWSRLSVTCDRSVVFSVSSTYKTDCHHITETLLKVALNTTALTPKTSHSTLTHYSDFDPTSLYSQLLNAACLEEKQQIPIKL